VAGIAAHAGWRTPQLTKGQLAVYDLVLSILAENDLAARNRVIGALQSHGAASPATARSLEELNMATDETWNRLVIEGRVREGPPGRFYLFERPRAGKRQRIITIAVFYAVILLVPIVLILINRKG